MLVPLEIKLLEAVQEQRFTSAAVSLLPSISLEPIDLALPFHSKDLCLRFPWCVPGSCSPSLQALQQWSPAEGEDGVDYMAQRFFVL